MATAEQPRLPTDDSQAARTATRRGARLRARFAGIRAGLEHRPRLLVAYRVLVAVIGTAIVVGGLILVPLPGPGWAIVFVGIAVLGTEFAWARRLAHWVRAQLARFWAWWKARRAARAARR